MNITSHITSHELSRSKICQKAGISTSYLSMIESGDRRIGANKVAGLASALEVEVADLRPDLAEIFGHIVDREVSK